METSSKNMEAIERFMQLVERKTLDSNDQNQVADQRSALKQSFAGGFVS